MPNPNAASPVDPQILTLFQEELARAAAMPGLAPPGPALWPRFAGYYHGLVRLPRKAAPRPAAPMAPVARRYCPPLRPRPGTSLRGGDHQRRWRELHLDRCHQRCQQRYGHRRLYGGKRRRPLCPSFGSTHTLTAVNNNTYGPTGLPVITSEITISSAFVQQYHPR